MFKKSFLWHYHEFCEAQMIFTDTQYIPNIFFPVMHKKPHIGYVTLFIYTPTSARNGFRAPSGGHTSALITWLNGYFWSLFFTF